MKTVTIRNIKGATVEAHESVKGGYLTFTGEIEADDDYHTFDELYEHRYALFLALVKMYYSRYRDGTWCSKFHADGTMFEGQFIMGIHTASGEQITYHLPLKYWDEATKWAIYRNRAPVWDGHSSQDVIARLLAL